MNLINCFISRLLFSIILGVSLFSPIPVFSITMDQIPDIDKPDWLINANSENLAFAYFDYTTTTGYEGEYTTLEKGALSLFDESQSGISEFEGDWTYEDGVGWKTNGSSITFHWKNVRVPENRKFFAQSVTFGGGTITGINVTTDNGNDNIAFPGWVIHDNRLIINATITPQPNDVWVEVIFAVNSPLIINEGWVLDQCTPIPEPSTNILLGFTLLSLAGILRKNLMI